VSLGSTVDVRNVLSKRRQLPEGISIRPDRSVEERKIWAILQNERKRLMEVEIVEGNLIKIRNSRLFVDGQLRGKVLNFTYVSSSATLGEVAPILNELTQDINDSATTALNLSSTPVNQSLPIQSPVPTAD
jgi:hypothetical protein